MKAKINVVEILRDKPKYTKLYSSACGKCKLEEVDDKSFKISFYNSKFGFMNGGEGYLDKNGKLYDDGECVVFPSKEMRDWRKFAWKKGDVLVNSSGFKLFFDRWANDDYTRFFGKVNLLEDSFSYETEKYTLASKEETLDTLEIEKPEFKDGDIVFMKGIKSELFANCIFILRSEYKDGDERAFYYAFYNADDKYTLDEYGNTKVHYSLRLATDSEKQQLFDALSKKGKRWDAEKKAIVDLKPKIELKPFDKVLVRDSESDKWRANLFGYIDKDEYYHCVYANWAYCIPYIGNESLLGTTKDVEDQV